MPLNKRPPTIEVSNSFVKTGGMVRLQKKFLFLLSKNLKFFVKNIYLVY